MQWNSPIVHNGMPQGTISNSRSSICNRVSCLHDWLPFANAINYSRLSQLIALRNLTNPTCLHVLEWILTLLLVDEILLLRFIKRFTNLRGQPFNAVMMLCWLKTWAILYLNLWRNKYILFALGYAAKIQLEQVYLQEEWKLCSLHDQ